jgi:hypothetical protein
MMEKFVKLVKWKFIGKCLCFETMILRELLLFIMLKTTSLEENLDSICDSLSQQKVTKKKI